jgi:serine/threonine protein kinase
MGIVYEARQVSLNRRVALKVLSGGLHLMPKAVQRFRREAEAAAKLHHTNIVPVYATGEQGGTHFYAMELVDGPALDHVIRQSRQHEARTEPTPDPDLAALGRGEREQARCWFRKSAEHPPVFAVTYLWMHALRDRLLNDPTWPPGLSHQK